MYAREINGEEFTFGVSGKLIRNVLVMYDRQTNSLWSQLIGESVEGQMIGTKLEFLPSWMTTWEQWREMHPDTLALNKGYRGARDPYEGGYYQSGRAGVIGETFDDDRLYVKEFVIGVELDDTAIAYPFGQLTTEPVLNDTVNSTDLVVVFDPDGGSGTVYEREVAGQLLTFESTGQPFEIRDQETGTVWNGTTGEAVEGELVGESLTRLKSTTVFWFGWKDFHPDTIIYGIEG